MAALVLSLPAFFALVAPPRIAVFGGSGFVGSRVCKTLVDAGCDVISISRAGRAPKWAAAQPWSAKVQWESADALTATRLPIGGIDGAVSCVGNLRPSPEWEGFFGLQWDLEVMRLENGLVNERIAEAARAAGARRFVYVSVSSMSSYACAGALEG